MSVTDKYFIEGHEKFKKDPFKKMSEIDYFSEVKLDEIESALRTISTVQFTSIWDFLKQVESLETWIMFRDWEELDELVVYERLTQNAKPVGVLYLVTERSHREKRGGIRIDSCNLEKYIGEHLDIYNECFFNLDTLIFSIKQGMAWILHHEGAFTVASKIFKHDD